MSDCHQHRPDQLVFPKGLSLSLPPSLSLSKKAAKFYITRSNASDERKHYPRFSTIYTLVWIHNKIGVRPCDILCSFHFSFSSPLPDSCPLFYPIIQKMPPLSHFHFHSIPSPSPPFFCPKYITLFIYLYTHSQRRTQKKKSPLSPTPLHRKKSSQSKIFIPSGLNTSPTSSNLLVFPFVC